MEAANRYDQLNRIKESRAFTNLTISANTWQASAIPVPFTTQYGYDQNGNLNNLIRADHNGLGFDVLLYQHERDVDKLRYKRLKATIDSKITQIENAKSIAQITGIKRLRAYKIHYRIKVETLKTKYRIGAIVRGNTIWLVRFSPRKKIYFEFP